MRPAPFFADVASAPDGARALWIETTDGFRIRIVVWTGGAQGTAFVFQGRSEYAEKYGRVAGKLLQRGFSVLAIDWRGQGLSQRYPDKPKHGHVRAFPDFQRDAAAAFAAAPDLGLPRPYLLVAHSMGGCIASRTLRERDEFRAAVLSAPMWGLPLRTALREAGARLLRNARLVGIDGKLPPGTASDPGETSDRYRNNALTSDEAMFDWAFRQVATHPELGLGPASAGWTRAAILEMIRLRSAAPLTLPALVLVGTDERIVSQAAIRREAARMPRGRLLVCEGARHEIFMETETTRAEVWRAIDRLIEERVSGPDPVV
jgi:lysophospholipase